MLVCALNLPQSYTLTHPHVETDFLHIIFDFFSLFHFDLHRAEQPNWLIVTTRAL